MTVFAEQMRRLTIDTHSSSRASPITTVVSSLDKGRAALYKARRCFTPD
jgi:hypothetical protein